MVLFYGLAKGARDICKKKALSKNTVIEVLFFHILVSFILISPEGIHGWGLAWNIYGLIGIKSFVIFMAWMCSFSALNKLPISVMGVLDLSRVVFATLLGVLFLGETMSEMQIWGMAFVATGLLMLPMPNAIAANKMSTGLKKEPLNILFVFLAVLSCILNAISGTMDKYIMGMDITSGQLQFWYMLFLLLYYSIYILIKRIHLDFKSLFKNYWILILSVLFVLADKALFVANGDPSSKVTIMTLIKQSSCMVTILGGKFIYKEKNIGYKLICASVIIVGILIAVIL